MSSGCAAGPPARRAPRTSRRAPGWSRRRRSPASPAGSEDFAGWLFGIARKLSLNAQRRAVRRERIPLDGDTGRGDPGPEAGTSGGDWARRLLATLPERERDVVVCREVLDMDVPTTAEALEISAVAVRVAHHRALKRLRRDLGRAEVGVE
ncbi:RNA polymerase subunit sigma-70 [Nocardioides sp. W3-2-3]|uniref:RNA polymerase sigma factor n=1 Tax=Nocardioides convexus TaxID=2712224 RepID=UPI0024183646|nr:sigma factor-like helix-turn-helix DNA-binding protein [Nocardioides convexus]NHA00242.1 RNA polymerase subunit sigma-70 [Nocardioides convexus]